MTLHLIIPDVETTPNHCVCCDEELTDIDPENICMTCVDMGCNVNN